MVGGDLKKCFDSSISGLELLQVVFGLHSVVVVIALRKHKGLADVLVKRAHVNL